MRNHKSDESQLCPLMLRCPHDFVGMTLLFKFADINAIPVSGIIFSYTAT